MNRPTPDPSQEGSRHSCARRKFPSWEGLGVGSWSQCMRKSEKRLSRSGQAGRLPYVEANGLHHNPKQPSAPQICDPE